MSEIFISYRRVTDKHAAGRLRMELSSAIKGVDVFLDVESIPPGFNFEQVISGQVDQCKVMIAVISAGWLTARDDHGRLRLTAPGDYVRLELARALARGIPVVPVLLDGASMPTVSQLPKDLADLSRRHAFAINHSTFQHDVKRLSVKLEDTLGVARGFGRIKKVFSNFMRAGQAQPPQAASQHAPAAVYSDVERFYNDCVRFQADSSVTATQLYESYCEWCDRQNREPLALPTFGNEFGAFGVEKERTAGRVRYMRIALSPSG